MLRQLNTAGLEDRKLLLPNNLAVNKDQMRIFFSAVSKIPGSSLAVYTVLEEDFTVE